MTTWVSSIIFKRLIRWTWTKLEKANSDFWSYSDSSDDLTNITQNMFRRYSFRCVGKYKQIFVRRNMKVISQAYSDAQEFKTRRTKQNDDIADNVYICINHVSYRLQAGQVQASFLEDKDFQNKSKLIRTLLNPDVHWAWTTNEASPSQCPQMSTLSFSVEETKASTHKIQTIIFIFLSC